MHYVYILESLVDGDYYKGSSENFERRLEEHNRGECQFTRTKIPWKLIFVETFKAKREALIREKRLKRCNKAYLQWLMKQPVNILNFNLDR